MCTVPVTVALVITVVASPLLTLRDHRDRGRGRQVWTAARDPLAGPADTDAQPADLPGRRS
ncbi:hypothetical protein GCM10023082_54740 [Streptomyces tremellae]|uniref:Uncharacterized protein n=1 Tax=Streptomyces tremellae TaxID=1124239 RepID=A0ABP7G045_9ACTN